MDVRSVDLALTTTCSLRRWIAWNRPLEREVIERSAADPVRARLLPGC
jgi:hypothetical protein